MRLYYKSFLLILVLSNSVFNASSQDVGFSQFYDQPLLRNPALAGIFTGDVRLVASYRNQWQSVTIPYRTFGLSAEIRLPVRAIPITVGLQVIRDVAGTSEFSTTQILPAANLSIPFGADSYLSVGVMGGLMQQRFDPTKLVLNDQFVSGSNGTFSIAPTSRQAFNNTSINYWDLSGGICYSGVMGDSTDYFIGAGLFHVEGENKRKVGFFEGKDIILNRKATLNFGLSVPMNDEDRFILYGDYFSQLDRNFKQVGISTLQVGMIYSHDFNVFADDHKAINAGILYRWDDAIIPVVQLEISKFTIGTSYDVNISKLVVASQYRGGFELTLTYKDFLNYNNRGIPCPKFGGHLPTERYIGY